MAKVVVDPERCALCGQCLQLCPMDILVGGPEFVRTVEPNRCYYCGHCKAGCPEDALDFPELPREEFKPVLPRSELQPDKLLLRFRSRRTTRRFTPDPVEREKIEKIILAGQYAPTGNNRQGVGYLVVHSPAAMVKLKEQATQSLADLVHEPEKPAAATGNPQEAPARQQAWAQYSEMFRKKLEAHRRGEDRLFFNAPALILCHIHPSRTLFPAWDAALAAMQMVLMAEALELGTCFNGALVRALEHSPTLRASLPIPEGHEVPVSFMVGYPALDFRRTVYRRPAETTWV